MKKILVATNKPFTGSAINSIKNIVNSAGFEFRLLERYTDEELVKAIKDIDAIIVRSDIVSEKVIRAANKLKIIVRAGAGYDNIDLNTCIEKSIIVMNTPGQNANAVAELTLGMMLYIARGFYSGISGIELKGKILGIHGFGHVGKAVARIAKGFDMKIISFDPFVKKEVFINAEVENVDIEELYSRSNFVSVNIPANIKTIGIIGYSLLFKMPQKAILVNTARKEVINERDLLRIFEERSDLSYISDIAPDCIKEFEERFKDRFFFTPKKIGAETEEANSNAGLAAANQIIKYFETGDITFKVN